MNLEENGASSERWEGYSDYQTVSNRVARSIDNAIEAYAALDALHAEGARVRPERAAEARRYILSAAMKLVPELEANRKGADDDQDDVYSAILERWRGEGSNGDGYLERLREVQLQNESPEWLYQFVNDIRKAGFEIGYLQAGRTVKDEELESDEAEIRAMFE